MGYKSDIEIAQECTMQPITAIAEKAGIDDKYLEQYGKYKAKIDYNLLKDTNAEDGKLILVTAINPTPAGEGKTTTSVGLVDGLSRIGKKAMVALREPSLGPVFGVKGGAAGGGYAQVVPMEDINLHFTGDFHAIGAANNLLAAMIDNHIFQGNALNIDPRKITWKRCVDMKYWQGLGYYSRARNLHAAAKSMNGKFPASYQEVRALKGVGDYTAAAICSIAYNMPYAVVDGNVYRVLSRYWGVDTPIDSTEGKRFFAVLADEMLDKSRPAWCQTAFRPTAWGCWG